jgi:DNA-binding MarR family transcriptional regulator
MNKTTIRRFRQTIRRFERVVATQLKGTGCCNGVSLAQCHALLEIEIHGPLGLNELAKGLGLDKSTLSRTIDGLVNIGQVQRDPNPFDRRSVILNLTPQGRQTCDRINAQNDALFSRILGHIPDEEREIVMENFKMLIDAMAVEIDNRCGLGEINTDNKRTVE